MCQTAVIGVYDFLGAFFRAFSAGDTLFHIHIPGVPGDVDMEISRLTGNRGDFRKGQNRYVAVPADLDQFRGDHSHGTIIGGKGFVQL